MRKLRPNATTPTPRKLRPLGDRLVVQVDPAETMIGTLYLPDKSKEDKLTGTVLSCGELVSEELRPGMRVLFTQYAGHALGGDDTEDILILQEADILGVLL